MENATLNATTLQPFTETGAILAAALLVPLAVFGTLANLLTIIVIATSKSLRSVLNILIISLAVSDLIAALNSPLNLYRRTWGHTSWGLPDGFCKLYMGLDIWTSSVTSYHILLFSIIRLISMKWPYRYKEIKQVHVKIAVSVIWTITFFVTCIPGFLSFGSGSRGRSYSWADCTVHRNNSGWFSLYSAIVYPLFFYVPMFATAVLSVLTAAALLQRRWDRSNRQKPTFNEDSRKRREEANRKLEKKENHAMLQLGLIVGSFMMAYIPLSAYTLHWIKADLSDMDQAFRDWDFWLIAYVLMRLSECLNPIFYNIASTKMRRETFSLLSKICCFAGSCGRGEEGSITSSSINGAGRRSSFPPIS